MGDRAGVWLRVSTRNQDEQSQVPDVMAWCESHGYEVVKPYQLKGRSAYKGEQAAMLADIRAGRIDVLVVWKVDRSERRGPRWAFNLIHDVREAGGRIEFVTETYLNVDGPAADLMLANMATMAREESKTKSDRVRIGRDAARANGGAVSGAPWGYRVTGPKRGKQFTPTVQGRRYVPEIFRRIADGESLADAVRWLDSERITWTHKGERTARKWYPRTIGLMIRNPAYKGTVVNGEGLVVHCCEPLVDAALWKRTNDALDSDTRRRRGPNQVKALLSGVAVCGECGSPLYRTGDSPRRWTRYYRCQASHGVAVPLPDLDRWVSDRMAAHGGFMLRETVIPGKTYQSEIEAAEWELRELGRQGLDEDAEDARRTELRAERRRLKSLPAEPPKVETEVLPVTVGDLWEMLSQQQRREFLLAAGITVKAVRGRYELDGDPTVLGTSGALWDIVEDLLGDRRARAGLMSEVAA